MKNIFNSYNIDQFGFCSFSLIENNLLQCRNLSKLPTNAKTVISFLIPYKTKKGVFDICDFNSQFQNISSYAIADDYHNIANTIIENITADLKKLYPNEEFVGFCDNSPIPEVRTACHCGLGVIGKHSLLINPVYGSWVFIAEIVTTLQCDNLYSNHSLKGCVGCNLCVNNCPTACIKKQNDYFEVDETYCLSAVTQKKGELSNEEINTIKKVGYVWGCDLCQLNCVMNKNSQFTPIKIFQQTTHTIINSTNAFTLENRAYTWRGKKVMQRNCDILEK